MKNQLSTEEVQSYFPDFSEPGLQQAIADQGRILHFKEGDVIMEYGQYVRMIPLILSGTIKVSRMAENDAELFLYYLSRGESCTMTFSCCMSDKQSKIRAVAEEDTVILALPQQKLDEWMMRYKSWKNFVLRAYDQRMNELINTVDQIAFNQLDEQILEYLRKWIAVHQTNEIRTTHQRIADDLNVSREAISRLLKNLEQRQIIELGRNRIKIIGEV